MVWSTLSYTQKHHEDSVFDPQKKNYELQDKVSVSQSHSDPEFLLLNRLRIHASVLLDSPLANNLDIDTHK
jgi:hypothetical protein